MYLAYFDESGDDGPVAKSPTKFFVLACVLVQEASWLQALDLLIDLRRGLRNHHGIGTRAELKGAHFRSGRGPLRPLGWSRHQRMLLLRMLLSYVAQDLPIRIFGVAIDKAKAEAQGKQPRAEAWSLAMERVQRFIRDSKGEGAFILPDEGHGYFIRRLLRKMRRFHTVGSMFGTPPLKFPTNRIIEDPADRKSQDSYLVQVADWAAYACHRSKHVDPGNIVPPDLWDKLDEILIHQVSMYHGGPPGIVLGPR